MENLSEQPVCLLVSEYKNLCKELVCMLFGLKPTGSHAQDAFEEEIDGLSDAIDAYKKEIDSRQTKNIPEYDILYMRSLLNGGRVGVS